jgi:hypothetical protein
VAGLSIACVLRSGGDFDAHWVRALEAGVRAHLPPVLRKAVRFVCLSDVDVPCERIPLLHDWPRWWPKLELFRPGLFSGRVLYLDLDTLVVGDLSALCHYRGPFAMLADFYRVRKGIKEGESGVMAWTPGPHTAAIYQAYTDGKDPAGDRDGHYIRSRVRHQYLQDLYPGQIVSLKVHAKKKPPRGARLVCGHGPPRLSDPAAGWAHKTWRKLAYG